MVDVVIDPILARRLRPHQVEGEGVPVLPTAESAHRRSCRSKVHV